MKRHFRTFALTLLPFLIWFAEVKSRELVMIKHCVSAPELCVAEQVNPVDRISLGLESSPADGFSYYTQNFSGVYALTTIVAWNLISQGPARWATAGADTLLLLQITGWNGLLTELSHLVSHRPRPFVYKNPQVAGTEAAHYTSFYSGHTSFVAASLFAMMFCLIRRGAPRWLLLFCASSGQALILSTAIFRIFAGRHFVTDVLCGAIAGALTAYFVSRQTQENRPASGLKIA